jgi:hypothetical protein
MPWSMSAALSAVSLLVSWPSTSRIKSLAPNPRPVRQGYS